LILAALFLIPKAEGSTVTLLFLLPVCLWCCGNGALCRRRCSRIDKDAGCLSRSLPVCSLSPLSPLPLPLFFRSLGGQQLLSVLDWKFGGMEGSSERRRSCNAATLAAQLVFVVVVVVGGVCSLLSLLFLNERARGSCAQNYLSTKKTKKREREN